jgi:hypothetical protein
VRILKNLVANVLADANATELAKARAEAPKAREAKFDQGKTGSSVEGMKEYADKIKDAGEGIAKIADSHIMEGLVDILAAILEDIAIFGAKAANDTGGNEATRQIEEKLDYVMPIVDALKIGQSTAGDALHRIDDNTIHVKAEVENIEYKAERLADLLGRTLVGSGWIVRPTTAAISNVVPPVSIKDEMHGVETNIATIINTLNIQIVNITQVTNLLLVLIQFIINIFPQWHG